MRKWLWVRKLIDHADMVRKVVLFGLFLTGVGAFTYIASLWADLTSFGWPVVVLVGVVTASLLAIAAATVVIALKLTGPTATPGRTSVAAPIETPPPAALVRVLRVSVTNCLTSWERIVHRACKSGNDRSDDRMLQLRIALLQHCRQKLHQQTLKDLANLASRQANTAAVFGALQDLLDHYERMRAGVADILRLSPPDDAMRRDLREWCDLDATMLNDIQQLVTVEFPIPGLESRMTNIPRATRVFAGLI